MTSLFDAQDLQRTLRLFLWAIPAEKATGRALFAAPAALAGKGWNVILRLHGPLEPWFDKTRRAGGIELAK